MRHKPLDAVQFACTGRPATRCHLRDVAKTFGQIFSEWKHRRRLRTDKDVAALLGLDQSQANRYRRDDIVPSFNKGMELLERGGVRVRFIFDSDSVEEGEGTHSALSNGDLLPVVASVAAGTGRIDFDHADEPRALYFFPLAFLRSGSRWGLGHGEAQGAFVNGVSMEPEYPDNSIIALREIDDPRKIPDDTPVVFRERDSGESTLKLLERRRLDGADVLIGKPINQSSPTLIWPPGEVDITHVVVGMVKR